MKKIVYTRKKLISSGGTIGDSRVDVYGKARLEFNSDLAGGMPTYQ